MTKPESQQCPFCQQVNLASSPGQLVFSIRDRYPVSPGHTLVIPMAHLERYFEASTAVKEALWQTVEAETSRTSRRPSGSLRASSRERTHPPCPPTLHSTPIMRVQSRLLREGMTS